MSDYDIHSCGYYCDRHACIVRQRDELRDKLFASKPTPEPVAYINVEERTLEWAMPMQWETPTVVKMDKVPLYTAPPQRKWVGLTDEEVKEIVWNLPYEPSQEHIRAIEDKLKEKNT